MNLIQQLKQAPERPFQVTLAVYILLADLAFNIVVYLAQVLFYVYDARELAQIDRLLFELLLSTLAYAISLLVVWKIAQGRNWARWLLLVGLVLAAITTLCNMRLLLTGDPLTAITALVQIAATLVAVALLFQRPSSLWFKNSRDSGNLPAE